jgi:hypothetical protein
MAKNEELAEQYADVTTLCARLQGKLDAAEQRTKGVLRDKDRHVQEKYDHLRIIHEETQAELQSQLERNESMLSHMVKELSSQVRVEGGGGTTVRRNAATRGDGAEREWSWRAHTGGGNALAFKPPSMMPC